MDYSEAGDMLEIETRHAKDLEFGVMIGTATEEQLADSLKTVERLKEEILHALYPCPIRAQFALISRFAERKGLDFDKVAETWIRHNSEPFRGIWEEGERSITEIERKLHRKTGY